MIVVFRADIVDRVATKILSEAKVKQRAKMLQKFMKIALVYAAGGMNCTFTDLCLPVGTAKHKQLQHFNGRLIRNKQCPYFEASSNPQAPLRAFIFLPSQSVGRIDEFRKILRWLPTGFKKGKLTVYTISVCMRLPLSCFCYVQG
jgi:hypothetical protein